MALNDLKQNPDMVERVAQAICATMQATAIEPVDWEDAHENYKFARRQEARAALKESHYEELYEGLRDAANTLRFIAEWVVEDGSSPKLMARRNAINESAYAAFAVLAKIGGEA
jgi:hypothetical protein